MNRFVFTAILALTAMSGYAEHEIYNNPATELTPGIIATDSLPQGCNSLDYHLRVELPRHASRAGWTLKLTYDDGESTLISLKRKDGQNDDALYGTPLTVSIDGEPEYEIIKGIDPTVDGWSVTLRAVPGEESAYCSIGQRDALYSFPIKIAGLRTIESTAETKLKLSRLSLFADGTDISQSKTVSTREELDEYLAQSSNINEGVWRYLDRDTDPRRLNLGANYVLASVCEPDGTVSLLYLGHSGQANALVSQMKPLMLKGRLRPTVFIGHYDLEWYDAYGSKIAYETSADIIDGAILKLNFPMHGGSVRFQKALMPLADPIQ